MAGITARVTDNEAFEKHLKIAKRKNRKMKFTFLEGVWTISLLPIADFYEICKLIGEGIVVTLGYDLMSRGISFCSSERTPDALAATTLFFVPGVTLNCVSLVQIIGRITGCARSNLVRTLYSPPSVFANYINYNTNQEKYLDSLMENGVSDTKQYMKHFELPKAITRPLDRPKLNLVPKFVAEPAEIAQKEEGEIDGVKLYMLKRWLQKDKIVSRIIKYLHAQSGPITVSELKEGIMYEVLLNGSNITSIMVSVENQ